MVEILSKSEAQTKKVAKLLAEEIFSPTSRRTKNQAWVIGLEGELGSGKTRFIQGFAKKLGIRQRLTSPTFVLLKKYRIPKKKVTSYKLRVTSYLFHIDCYRLNKPKELLDLDFKEIISNPQNIVLIEWAEKVHSILPRDTIWVRFKIVSKKERRIKII